MLFLLLLDFGTFNVEPLYADVLGPFPAGPLELDPLGAGPLTVVPLGLDGDWSDIAPSDDAVRSRFEMKCPASESL